jgi:hypothetical protein
LGQRGKVEEQVKKAGHDGKMLGEAHAFDEDVWSVVPILVSEPGLQSKKRDIHD